MRVITDALPALIGYSDFTHHYRFVNKHYEALYGVKQKDIVGRTSAKSSARTCSSLPCPIAPPPSVERK